MIHPSTNADLAGFAFQFSIAKASFSGSFMESFVTLNIFNFGDVCKDRGPRRGGGLNWDFFKFLSSP